MTPPILVGIYQSEEEIHADELAESLKLNPIPLSEDRMKMITPPEIEDENIKKKFYELIRAYQDIFDWNNDRIGTTNLLTYKMEMEEGPPIRSRPYRLSPAESQVMKKEIDKLVRLGVLRPSTSEWSSPLLLIKKKNGSYRICSDMRKVNQRSRPDGYLPPRIDDLFNRLGTGKYRSTCDLTSAYYSVKIEEASIPVTAVVTDTGALYEYQRMVQGSKRSASTMARLADLVFKKIIDMQAAVVYLDDVHVVSKTPELHLYHLQCTFQAIRNGGLVISPSKTFCFQKSLKFLGHIFTEEGIQPDDSKLEAVKDIPILRTKTEARSFLGMVSYYRKFIPRFTAIARPLHNLTKDGIQTWSPAATKAFKKLKECLVSPPILALPNFECDRPIIIQTDACIDGLACIACQEDEDGKERVICYLSRATNKAEEKYAAVKLELCAVYWACCKLRTMLYGRKFILETDNTGIIGLITSSDKLAGAVARWVMYISEFDFTVRHKPDKKHKNVDYLSRLPESSRSRITTT